MKKIWRITGIVLISLLYSSCNDEKPSLKDSAAANTGDYSGCSYSHRFGRGYTTLYPREDALFYTGIQVADSHPSGNAVFLFRFFNTFSLFESYEFRQDNGIPVRTAHHECKVEFSRQATEDTYSTLHINVHSKGGKTSKFEMTLSFDPKIVQERSGRSASKDGLFVRKTGVPFLEILPGDFNADPPGDSDRKFLTGEFGKRITATSTETEKIRILAEDVLDLLEPFRGIPGNEMDTLSAAEQLKLLKQNHGKVYCGNISEIFLATCLSFGIPGRRIGLGNTYDDSKDPAIFHSDYHSTVEIYNKDLQSWVLVDLSFYLLEAKAGNGKIMNLIDFLYLLNSPADREKMVVSEYDPALKKTHIVRVSEAGNFNKLMDFYKQNQRFYFQHKKGFFSF